MAKRTAAGLSAMEKAAQNMAAGETEIEVKPDDPVKSKKTTQAVVVNMPVEVHQALREISFHSRVSMTKLILEGVDSVFKARGMPGIGELGK